MVFHFLFLALLLLGAAQAWAADCASKSAPPIIDLAQLQNQGVDLSLQVLQASEQWGFFQIIHHNISEDLINRLRVQMLWFFEKTLEEKLKVKRNATNARGFAHDELTKQLKDYKEIFDYGFGHGTVDGVNLWPESENTEFYSALKEYFEACALLAQIVTDLIAQSLDVNIEIFRQAFAKHSSFARLNYYPPYLPKESEKDSEPPLGISRHTDAGGLTILWQDSPGLQVYSGSKQDNADGEWVDLQVVEGALIVNVGDMMEVWSGGRIRAAEHRVVIKPGKRTHRLSAPFFYNPAYDAVIAPVTGTRKYRPFTWEQFRRARFAGDYADVGVESQIEDYEIK